MIEEQDEVDKRCVECGKNDAPACIECKQHSCYSCVRRIENCVSICTSCAYKDIDF